MKELNAKMNYNVNDNAYEYANKVAHKMRETGFSYDEVYYWKKYELRKAKTFTDVIAKIREMDIFCDEMMKN